MTELRRLLDDSTTSGPLRDALNGYPRPTAITPEALAVLTQALNPSAVVALDRGLNPGLDGAGAAANPAAGAGIHQVAAAATTKLGLAFGVKVGLVVAAMGAGGAGWVALRTLPPQDRVPTAATSTVASGSPGAVVTEPATAARIPLPSASDADQGRIEPATPKEPSAGPSGVDPASSRSATASSSATPSSTAAARATSRGGENGIERLEQRTDKSQLQLESELLEEARRLLDSAPRRTLEQIRTYRSRFVHPMLGLECDLLEIDALCRLGNLARAEQLGAALLAAQPKGMYAERARAILSKAHAKKTTVTPKDPAAPDNH